MPYIPGMLRSHLVGIFLPSPCCFFYFFFSLIRYKKDSINVVNLLWFYKSESGYLAPKSLKQCLKSSYANGQLQNIPRGSQKPLISYISLTSHSKSFSVLHQACFANSKKRTWLLFFIVCSIYKYHFDIIISIIFLNL